MTLDRLFMAYPGYGGGVSPGYFITASVGARRMARAGGATVRFRPLPLSPSLVTGTRQPGAESWVALEAGAGRTNVELQVFRSLGIPRARPSM